MAYVYRYTHDGIILYIGKARKLEARLFAHARDEIWANSGFCSIEYIADLSPADADILETYFIATLKPLFNKAKRWGKTSFLLPEYIWKRYDCQRDQRSKAEDLLHYLIHIRNNLSLLEIKAGSNG